MSLVALEKRQSNLENDMEKNKASIEAINERTGKVENFLLKIDESIDRVIDTKLQNYMSKKEDETRRSLNLVIYGVAESNSEDTGERKEDDAQAVMEIFSAIEVTSVKFEAVTRLGAKLTDSGKSRPIRIKMLEKEDKFKVLNNAKKLRKSRFEKIHIGCDLTLDQRRERKELVAELKSRRENGENNIVIRKNKIVALSGDIDNSYQKKEETTSLERE